MLNKMKQQNENISLLESKIKELTG